MYFNKKNYLKNNHRGTTLSNFSILSDRPGKTRSSQKKKKKTCHSPFLLSDVHLPL